MPALLDHNGSIEDQWQIITDDEPLQAGANCLVSIQRWQDKSRMKGQANAIGVILEPESDVRTLLADLDTLPMIAVQFKVFSDGRGFTQARLLRDRYGYRGALRAIGDVQRDQLAFMARCGIDQYQLAHERDAAIAAAAFAEFSQYYQ